MMCAHGREGQTHIKSDCALVQTELYCASVAVRVEKRANKNVKIMMLFSETETAKQNQKFPFHFFFRFAAEGWGEETQEKCKEIFWFLHTRVRERVRGALVCFPTQSERTRQFQATTRSARASFGVLLEMGSNFFKQTPQKRGTTSIVALRASSNTEVRRGNNR